MLSNGLLRYALSTVIVTFWITCSHADDDYDQPFIRYECIPELGYIEISSKEVRGSDYSPYLHHQRKELEAEGIFYWGYDEPPQVHLRVDTIDKRKIETRITTFAPLKFGYAGYVGTSTVEIKIDGKEKISCHFGYYAAGRQTVDYIRIFPSTDVVRISGHDDDGHIFDLDMFESLISNEKVFTDATLVAAQCRASGASSDPEKDAAVDGFRDMMVADMKSQVIEYLQSGTGVATVVDILKNTHGIESAMFVALFELQKEGKVTWPDSENGGLNLSVVVSLTHQPGPVERAEGSSNARILL